jgi:hypothetical protein
MLKLAAALHDAGDSSGYARLCVQFGAYIKKCAHYVPVNDGTAPNPLRFNMDYDAWENSPYYGSVSEFMEKFPGGIPDWVKWRKETQKKRNLMWSEISARREDVRKKIANKKDDDFLVWKFTAHHTMLLKHEIKERIKYYLEALLKQPDMDRKGQIDSVINILEKQKYQIIERYVDYAVKFHKLESMIRTLVRYKGNPQYSKYVKLFETIRKKIIISVFERFDREMWDIKTASIEVEEIKEESNGIKTIEAKFIPVGPDDTDKFPGEPHLWSDEGLNKFKSVKEYLKKYRGQEADDMGSAALRAIQDFINYWKLLEKGKKKRTKSRKAKS